MLCVTAYLCVLISVPLTYVWAFGFVGCILFQTEDFQIVFSSPIPDLPDFQVGKARFSNRFPWISQCCLQNLAFLGWAIAFFRIEDIQIVFSSPAPDLPGFQFCLQNLAFWRLGKRIFSNRRYSNWFFVPGSWHLPANVAKFWLRMSNNAYGRHKTRFTANVSK